MPETPETTPQRDERVDDFASEMFSVLGYDPSKLPDSVVACYKEFKKHADKIRPARMSLEGFVFVAMMADIVDGRFVMNSPPSKEKKVNG